MYLDYFGIRVLNLKKSLKFYRELSPSLKLRQGTMGHGGTWVLLEDRITRQRVELNHYPRGNPYATPYMPGEGLDHFDVLVPDVREASRDLVKLGGRPTGITAENSHGWQACFLDPNGLWIALDKYGDKQVRTGRAIHCAGLRVTDLKRSLKFYTDVMGLREVHRGDMSAHGRGTFVLLEDGISHQRLELNYYPKGSPFATPYEPGEGLDHLGFRTLDRDRVVRRMKRAGSKLMAEVWEGNVLDTVQMSDPDGNWIELIASG
jgi:lactoylglutathione lyase